MSVAAADPLGKSSYSLFARIVHWLWLVLVVTLFILAWTAELPPETPGGPPRFDPVLVTWHRSIGITVWLLTLARAIERRVAGKPAWPAGLPAWQRPASAMVHWALYVLLLTTPIFGYLASNGFGETVNFYFLGNLPSVIEKNEDLAGQIYGLHDLAGTLIEILVGIHVLAALYHQFVQKDAILRRMLRI